MRKTMKKLTQGATRLLVLALGLGLVSTVWAATAPTPTAVWEAGEFQDTASSHGGYSISLNGNSVVDGKIVISSAATKGVTIDIEGALGDTSGRDVSVLIKYSGAKAPANQAVFVCNYSYKDSGKYDTGLASKEESSGALKGYWNTTMSYPMKTADGTEVYPSVTDNNGAGYLLFSYKHNNENGVTKGVYGYNGSSVSSMTGGSNADLCWPNRYLSKVAIGGPSGEASTSYGVWPDLVIEGIAIFVDKTYTNSDLAAYVFPSDYDYVATISANTSLSDITTWTKGSGTPGTDSKVCINTENGAVLTVSGTLDYEVLHVLGDGSITLANGANISSTIISGVDMNIAASTEVTVSNSSILNKIGCNGKLITNGDVKLLDSGNNFAYGSEIYVATGTATVNAYFTTTYTSAGRGLHGNITIAKYAKFVNSRTEAFDCNADANHPIVVDVSGTLSLGSTRWTLGNNNKIVLHEGGRVEGDGDSSSNGAFDLENNVTGFTIEADGNAEFAALVRIRNTATLNVDVAAGKTLTFSTKGFVATTGKLIKTGDGTLANTINSSYTGLTTVSAGRIESTSFPSGNVSIGNGATFTLKNVEWTAQPSRFSGEGTLELYNDRGNLQHCIHTVTGVTFSGTLKFTATNTDYYGSGHLIRNVGFLSSEVRPQLELNTITGIYSKLFFDTIFNEQTIAVRDLKGTGHLSAKASGGSAQNQTLETKQTQNTEFSGNLVTDDAEGEATHKTNLHVIGDDSGTVKTLTISGANTSVGELKVCDGAKVSFASTGSWANGTVTVEDGGVLESQKSGAISATLAVKKGAVLKFAAGDQSIQATAYDWSDVDEELEENERIKVDISEATPSNTPISIIPSGVTVDVSKFVISPALNPYTTPYSAALSVDNGALKVTYSGNFCQDGSWLVGPTANGDAKVWLTQNSTLTTTTDLSLGSVAFFNRAGDDVTLTVDGTGELKFGGLNLPSKITIDVAGKLTITGTVSGAGTINVLDGGELTIDGATCATTITVQDGGKLYTKGTTTLSSSANVFYYGSEFEVVDGTTTLTTASAGLKGAITIDGGATLAVGANECINSSATSLEPTELHVYGSLNMSSYRWVFRENNALYFYTGCTFTGEGPNDGFGPLEIYSSHIYVRPNGDTTGTVTLPLETVFRRTTPVDVADNMNLTISGYLEIGYEGDAVGFTKTGAGDFTLTPSDYNNTINFVASTVSAGRMIMERMPMFPSVVIEAGATFTLQNAAYTEDKFSGAGTLELLKTTSGNINHTATSTFSGTLKVTRNTGAGHHAFGNDSASALSGANLILTGSPSLEIGGTAAYMCLSGEMARNYLAVANLTGSGTIDPVYTATTGTKTIRSKQTDNTTFSGVFSGTSPSSRDSALYVYGENSTVKSLTLSGVNTTYGPLTVDTYGKVVFSTGGSWRNGTVTVGANGYLESTNATAITKLALENGANIVFPTSSSSFTDISSITFASGTVTISYPSGVTPTSGTKLINWSSAPAGSFVFDNDSDVKRFGESYYLLQKEADGLYVRKAIALTITPPSTYYYHPSVAAALLADNTAYLLDAPNEVVVLAVGKTINNAMGKDVSNLTVNPTTAEYAVQYVNGSYTVANTSTTYYWTGTTDSAWATLGNWKVGASDGPVATRTFESTDSVVFNNGATVTLGANVIVAGVTVNGAVSISGTAVELKTTGNITGTGTLTLNDVCLSGDGANITVAPNIHFTNDSEFAGDDAMTINGNVEISGSFKIWGVNHIIAGTAQINGGADFGWGNAWLMINGAATVKGAFTTGGTKLKFSNSLTIEAGGVTVDGSSVNLDSDTATIVLAGTGATLTDSRGTPIADNKVSTTVVDSYVKKTGSTFAVAAKPVVTISVGANVSLTIDGNAVADGDTFKFFPGDTFTYVATPAANYTANVAVTGGTDNDGTVTVGETAITVAATATCNGATVSNVAVSYGTDYTSATVTATVSDANLDYYISWASGEPVKGTVSGSTVRFDVSGIVHSEPYQSSEYNIAAKDGETAVTTTGGTGESVAADVDANWINENATTHGQASAGGSWTNADAVTYSEGKAAISDNRFVATTASTASRVVLAFEVCFSSTSEDDVSGEAQAAIKLGAVNDATTFMVLTTGNTWTPVSNAELPIDASATYDVVLTIDYGTNTYKVDIEGYSMTNSAGIASFSLAANRSSVQNIDFAGSGTLTSMKGDQIEGYMVVDKNGTRYASISAAIDAYVANPAIGPLRVLHDGTAPSGWKIVTEGGVDILKKIAKGLFFMAY